MFSASAHSFVLLSVIGENDKNNFEQRQSRVIGGRVL